MNNKVRLRPDTRRALALVFAWGGWAGAVGLTALRVTEHVGQVYGVSIILLIGIAIAAGNALSRMRITAAMVSVFNAGIAAGAAASTVAATARKETEHS